MRILSQLLLRQPPFSSKDKPSILLMSCFVKMPVISYLRICCLFCYPSSLQIRAWGLEYSWSLFSFSELSAFLVGLVHQSQADRNHVAGKIMPGSPKGLAFSLVPLDSWCMFQLEDRQRKESSEHPDSAKADPRHYLKLSAFQVSKCLFVLTALSWDIGYSQVNNE